MKIDWWTLGLQTVNVLVLVWILSRFLFRPVTAIIAERQASAARLLDDARAARDAALVEKAKIDEEAARQAAARTVALTSAAAEAATEKTALLAAARIEAEQKRVAAETEFFLARQSETAATADRASLLAVDIASKLLDRLPPEARVVGFIEGMASQLGALPPSTRHDLATSGEEARLKAPRALTDEELKACGAAFSRAIGRPVIFAVEIDPGLIAGLEFETRHALVRNSFRFDLDRIATELTRHDHARQ
ncbi:hypothetical protein [Rhodoblastus sp.]|jgi:F-type H+-transporting ATPase subunit b|uniref:hypothetical protein n=1 Tax=Rhodoblastus sp. TaxID=1962975 RepID=UPI0025ED5C31|nr:hypothetical protein [Rhodoblastus sp.]